MKRKISIFAFIICLVPMMGLSQSMKIQGYIFDSLSKLPIEQVEVILPDQTSKTITNRDGYFSLSVNALPCHLQFRNMSYQTKDVLITNNQNNLNVFLNSKSYDLKAVEISTNQPVQVMPDKHYQIMDYEFYNDKMLVLAYENQSFFNPVLLLITPDGDTLSRLEVSKPMKICKDFSGKVFLHTKTTAWEINTESNKLSISNPINIENYDAINNVIIAQSGTQYYLKQLFSSHQEVDYYNYEETTDTLHCFKTVVDEDNIKRNRKGVYFDGKEEDIRFQQLIMLKPVYAPLVCLKDTLVLFNFIDSRIEKFSASTQPISECKIDFHQDRNFRNELLVDETDAKIYFLFRKNGFSELRQVDLNSGKIIQTVSIPAFVFVEKIKVHDNMVYFLYKEKINQEYKKLYKLRI